MLSKRGYSPGSICICRPPCLSVPSSARGPFVRMTTPGKCLERERERGKEGARLEEERIRVHAACLSSLKATSAIKRHHCSRNRHCSVLPPNGQNSTSPSYNQLSHSSKARVDRSRIRAMAEVIKLWGRLLNNLNDQKILVTFVKFGNLVGNSAFGISMELL